MHAIIAGSSITFFICYDLLLKTLLNTHCVASLEESFI